MHNLIDYSLQKKEGRAVRITPHQWKSVVEALPSSSPSQTLRLTPLTSALRAARAHDAVLRMYPICLCAVSRYFGFFAKKS